MKQALHFSGLNGLRAIAALGVMFSHTTMALDDFGLNALVFGTFPDGKPKATLLSDFGVTIFFALSGFLITYLLLEEKKVQEINIKNFYIRRILRIWPLYYLYMIISIVTLIAFDIPFAKHSLLFYVFLMANIPFTFGGYITFLEHYWSLGVEEQFYSFWPWILKKTKHVLTVTVIICSALILLQFGLRLYDIRYNNGDTGGIYDFFHTTRFQCMLIGAIGAILYFKRNELFLRITNNLISQSIAWIIIFLVAINKFHLISMLDNELISVVTVFLIIGQIQKTKRIINLELSFFDFIGKISYGVYIIHPLVIFYLSKAMNFTDANILNYILVYISVFIVTIIAAFISYNYFEKRFLGLKEKYSTVRSAA